MNERFLIVDDEMDMLDGLKRLLSFQLKGVTTLTAANAQEALRLTRQAQVDLILLDIRMPDIGGLELLEVLLKEDPWLTIIMMTAFGSIEQAVEAMKKGAYDFITKPFDKESLLRTLKKGLERNRLVRENLNLRQRVGDDTGFHGLVGQSQPLRRVFDSIQAIARTDYTVLVRGESGTGKELIARALHALGKRKNGPFITVNCPAMPEHLMESELFGYRKGAFTGADRDHAGLFEEADGGTLFLDEVGDIPVSLQTKLLRAIQEQEIKPLGAAGSRKVDVRTIAATNQNLEEKIKEKTFREDLYYRLNVVSVRAPSLRTISKDIPQLANHFARIASLEMGISPRRFTPEALEILMRRDWPGNVRELQNIVRRTVVFSAGNVIRSHDLRALESQLNTEAGPEPGMGKPDLVETYKQAKDRLVTRFTHDYITNLLQKTGGNITKAAEMSGLGRASLWKIMNRLGIRSGNSE
ncbi:MAG: sigma-54-dependent Fis family transcriptional regulator [Deltaproteobacteria bacterium HGW-Deltaproteobacteria-15]|jgi:DNA-binding NtrC family response regulator|nr:MAG: sigma-54-dependent Fis family transcriptional regulator [Deltaproteobacteria bacterium HGW-Deltaproteobacteria-15]